MVDNRDPDQVDHLIDALPEHGYIAVQAYLDRVAHPQVAELRGVLTAGGAPEPIPDVDQSELDRAWPAIEASIRANCDGPIYPTDEVREKAFTH